MLNESFGSVVRRLRGRPRQGEQIAMAKERFGTDYGGYFVRTEQLCADSIVYSFGLGEDVSFDLALIERFGCTVHAFDPTPRSIEWVKRQKLPERFVLHEVGLADFDGTASFAPPENPDHVSHQIASQRDAKCINLSVRRLTTLVRELGHQRIDILKMDIEGAEYAVIEEIGCIDPRPLQLLVEFHHRRGGVRVTKTEAAIAKLNQAGYRIFDARPSGREFSFVWTGPSREGGTGCPRLGKG